MSLIWTGTSNLEAARRCEHCACYAVHAMRCCYCDFTPHMLRQGGKAALPTGEATSMLTSVANGANMRIWVQKKPAMDESHSSAQSVPSVSIPAS